MNGFEYGILLSHASRDVFADLVDAGFITAAGARAHGDQVCAAQPGIEVELMMRHDRASPWLSADGRTASEVIGARWTA